MKFMLITGIRQKMKSESNARRSAVVARYLIHFFQMFAFLGIIFPVLICVDYFSETQSDEEIIKDKYYKLMDNLNHIEYCFFTENYHFLSDKIFYDHTNKDDVVTLSRTPIFRTVTNVAHYANSTVCNFKPYNLYGWPVVFTFITFFLSIMLIVMTRFWINKRINIKYDTILNFGILNSIFCTITIVATLFHIPY
jgi:hypothetical protein